MERARNGEIEVVPPFIYPMDLKHEYEFLYQLNPLPEWDKTGEMRFIPSVTASSRRSRKRASDERHAPLPVWIRVADGFSRFYKMSHFVECVGGRMVLPVLSVRFATRETLRGQESGYRR